MFQPSAHSSVRRRLWLVLLFLLALGVRAFRAFQEPVVNPDAIRFIDQAKRLRVDPLGALRVEVYHPLHSIAALIVHSVLGSFFHNDRAAWLAAVQTVGVVCGSIVALQIFWLSRAYGAPRWAASAAALAWIVGRRSSSYGADGLSDMLFLAFFAAAMLTAIRAMRFPRIRDHFDNGVSWRFALAGVLAGFAYLTRPEGLSAPLIVIVTMLVTLVSRHTPRSAALKLLPRRAPPVKLVMQAAVSMLAGVCLPALPYMVAIGGITHKRSFLPTLGGGGGGGEASHVLAAGIVSVVPMSPGLVKKMGMELWETFGFAPTIALLGACLWMPHLWGRARLRPLVVVWTMIWLAVMAYLISHEGYLDGRHTLPLELVLFGLLSLAFVAWTKPMRWWMNWWRGKPAWDRLPAWMRWKRWPYAFAGCAVLLVLLPGVIRLGQPALEAQTFVIEAADWVSAQCAGGRGYLRPPKTGGILFRASVRAVAGDAHIACAADASARCASASDLRFSTGAGGCAGALDRRISGGSELPIRDGGASGCSRDLCAAGFAGFPQWHGPSTCHDPGSVRNQRQLVYTSGMPWKNNRSKPVIGLAGGIGSGKSLIARLFASERCAVIDSDADAHAVLQSVAVKEALRAWMGDAVFHPDGSVNRKAVGSRVFSDSAAIGRLNALIHPRVGAMREAAMAVLLGDAAVRAIVWDMPLLFEVNLAGECDAVVFVAAPREKRWRASPPPGAGPPKNSISGKNCKFYWTRRPN